MDKEKEILQLQMVLKGEKAFTENLKDTITVLKMQVAALLDLNAEYANKIIQLEKLLERLPTKAIQEFKRRERKK
tara:strand:- start:1167 stop:1391 length:225 start_codon:yes stop_codon:yes gene_type:complete